MLIRNKRNKKMCDKKEIMFNNYVECLKEKKKIFKKTTKI